MAVPECRSLNVKRICREWLSSGSSTGRNQSVETFCPLFTSCWAFFFSPPVSMCSHVTVLFLCVSQSLSMSHVPPPHTLSTNPPTPPFSPPPGKLAQKTGAQKAAKRSRQPLSISNACAAEYPPTPC